MIRGDDLKIPITKSARKFGYIIWNKRTDPDIKKILGELETVNVYFNGLFLGRKKVDRTYFRISLGYKFPRALPLEASYYILNLEDNDSLRVEWI